MKTLKYIFVAAALGLTATSCYDLDLEPKGLIYENVLFQSDNGIKKVSCSDVSGSSYRRFQLLPEW